MDETNLNPKALRLWKLLKSGYDYAVDDLTEEQKALCRELVQVKFLHFDKEKRTLTKPNKKPMTARQYMRALAPDCSGGSVASLVYFLYGSDSANFPLYAKFGKLFNTSERLITFLWEHRVSGEGDPISELYPLAYTILGEAKKDRVKLKRREAHKNRESNKKLLQRMKEGK